MNTEALNTEVSKAGRTALNMKEIFRTFGLSSDVMVFIALIVLANTHLVTGNLKGALAFYPSAVVSGEWWRLLFHPFVHLTWYHLALDAGAFFLLYRELSHCSLIKRTLTVIAAGTFSLVTAMLVSPEIDNLGLCGLSGIAHGLMAVSALHMLQRKEDAQVGLLCLVLVISKSIYEAVAGDVLFAFLHFGLCGTPLAASHAGGVLGGIAAYYAGNKVRDARSR